MKKNGFTIIEVMIVLAIAGLILGVVFLAIPNLQRDQRDNERKRDLATISAALLDFYANNRNYAETGSGCGYSGNGDGWMNYSGGSYPESIADCLGLPSGTRDPGGAAAGNQTSSPTSGGAYMKYTCTQSGRRTVYVYAKLESLSQEDTATDGTCCPTCDSSYGMNYFLKI